MTPTVATVHSVIPDAPALVRSAIAVTGFPAHRVAFTAVSDAAALPWRRAMGARMPVSVLPNGIDPLAWATDHIASPETFTVVSVGRFAPRKRQRALVAMLAQLREDLPSNLRLRAVMIGDGDQMPDVRHDVRRFDLADVVELPGALSRDEIKRVLAHADVFAAPATLESFGIAALEARCAGVPVVAMRQGGTGEFIRHGREGLLADSDTDMTDQLVRLATDRDLWRQISHHNSTTVPDLAWPQVLAQHDRLYQRAAARQHQLQGNRRLASVFSS